MHPLGFSKVGAYGTQTFGLSWQRKMCYVTSCETSGKVKREFVDEEERREAESFRRFLEQEKAKSGKSTTATTNNVDDDADVNT